MLKRCPEPSPCRQTSKDWENEMYLALGLHVCYQHAALVGNAALSRIILWTMQRLSISAKTLGARSCATQAALQLDVCLTLLGDQVQI